MSTGSRPQLTARAAPREQAGARRAVGLSRFLGDDRFDLDCLTAPEFDRRRVVWETAGTAGRSERGAGEHQRILAELRGEA